MKYLIYLAVHFVVEVCRFPYEVASTRERLLPRQLSPISLSVHGCSDYVVTVAWENSVKLLNIPVRLHLLMDFSLVLQLGLVARWRQVLSSDITGRWIWFHYEFVWLLWLSV